MNHGTYPSITILGSTGSVGEQAIDVARQTGARVNAISANRNAKRVEEQAREFGVKACAMADENAAKDLRERLADTDVRVYAGTDGICEMLAVPYGESDEIVLNSIIGEAGLKPTLATLRAGKRLALANKESLVCAGEIVMKTAREKGITILPVDSEHSAIFQCLRAGREKEIRRILLTASGGPFYGYTAEQLRGITPERALAHPTWKMGAKITVDSATLMNKGFEVIEAKWLFGVPVDRIQVLVHPQSVVHSAVQFHDGSVKAQLGVPDMRLPIQYAFSFPERLPLSGERLDLFRHPLEFFEPDLDKFRCLALAFEAIRRGGNMPCIVNAANEIVNRGFLEGRCGFVQMADIIAETMERATFSATPSYDTYVATDAEARRIATEIMNR